MGSFAANTALKSLTNALHGLRLPAGRQIFCLVLVQNLLDQNARLILCPSRFAEMKSKK